MAMLELSHKSFPSIPFSPGLKALTQKIEGNRINQGPLTQDRHLRKSVSISKSTPQIASAYGNLHFFSLHRRVYGCHQCLKGDCDPQQLPIQACGLGLWVRACGPDGVRHSLKGTSVRQILLGGLFPGFHQLSEDTSSDNLTPNVNLNTSRAHVGSG